MFAQEKSTIFLDREFRRINCMQKFLVLQYRWYSYAKLEQTFSNKNQSKIILKLLYAKQR